MAVSRSDHAPALPGLEPLFDADAQRRADARATAEYAIPSILLMERAGAEAAAAIVREHPQSDVLVVVGTGNNGGDGMVVARHLAEAGRSVRIAILSDAPREGDAGTMSAIAERIGVPVGPIEDATASEGTVVVDALLGTGARGAPRPPHDRAIGTVNAAPGPVVALDVPSGVDASTGRVAGVAVRADRTITFGADKVGLRVAPGRLMAGEVEIVPIGIPDAVREVPRAWLATAGLVDAIPAKSPGGEKYAAGAVLVVGGSTGMSGAPALAARAVLRAGGGLVVVAAPGRVQPLVAAVMPEAMVVPLPGERGHLHPDDVSRVLSESERVGALALGPGLGRAEDTTACVRSLVESVRLPLVLDADALWHLGARPEHLRERAGLTVLTPHAGEAARLLDVERAEVEQGRLDAAAELTGLTGAVVVLKGPGSIVSTAGEAPIVNDTGGPALSTAGTGDVLTGVIASLLARGLAPRDAAAMGAALHGSAGDVCGRADGATAGDIVEALPSARSGRRS